MVQIKRLVCLGLLGLTLGMAGGPALGDDKGNQAGWERLKKLSAGQAIQVVQTDFKSVTGSFVSVSDTAIVVNTNTGEQTVSRQDVTRVSSKGRAQRGRNILLGAGIGAGGGAGVGAAVKACPSGNCIGISKGEEVGILTAVGAIVGAVVGALLPTGGWHVIYRAH